jgi:hypothetical protein
MWKASLDTRNFSFEAYGTSEDAAIATLKHGWEIHARATGADMTWAELDEGGSVDTLEIELGVPYRDGISLMR